MTSSDVIKKIELFPVHIPFNEMVLEMLQGGTGNVAMSLKVDEHWLGGDFLICKTTTEDGIEGYGEAFVWLVESGVSPMMMAETIKDHLAKHVLTRSPFEIEAIKDAFDRNVARNEIAKGLIDLALHDTAAKSINRPVHDLYGGKQIDEIPLAIVVPLSDTATILKAVQMGLDAGIQTFRCKLGDGKVRDVEIIKSVRELVGPEARLRVDYNQAYTANEALACIDAIAPYDIDFAEQPVKSDNFSEMAWLQQRTNVPIMAHEGAFGTKDIFTLAEMGAVRTFGINPERPGGFSGAIKAIDYAAAKGLDVVLHNQPTGIGSAAMLHIHTSRARNIRLATELQGHLMLEHDLLLEGITYKDGNAQLPKGPGLGVKVDHNAIDRYQVGRPTIIEA